MAHRFVRPKVVVLVLLAVVSLSAVLEAKEARPVGSPGEKGLREREEERIEREARDASMYVLSHPGAFSLWVRCVTIEDPKVNDPVCGNVQLPALLEIAERTLRGRGVPVRVSADQEPSTAQERGLGLLIRAEPDIDGRCLCDVSLIPDTGDAAGLSSIGALDIWPIRFGQPAWSQRERTLAKNTHKVASAFADLVAEAKRLNQQGSLRQK
jgi:hypothetical protein